MISEKFIEYKIITHYLFVDFKSAYDSLDRPALYHTPEELNINNKVIPLVKMPMCGSRYTVRIGIDLSEGFETNHGVWQGDFPSLSPI